MHCMEYSGAGMILLMVGMRVPWGEDKLIISYTYRADMYDGKRFVEGTFHESVFNLFY